jgi:hypothetical protein
MRGQRKNNCCNVDHFTLKPWERGCHARAINSGRLYGGGASVKQKMLSVDR